MKKYILIFLTLTIVIWACNNNNSEEDKDTSLIEAFHEGYYDVNIAPALQNFKASVDNQVALATAFNESPTLENLNALQEQWLKSATSFTKVRAYNVVAVKAVFYDLLIYNFEINTDRIEDNIAEKTVFDEDFLKAKSTSTKGLGALEYLLFNTQNTDVAYNLFKEDSFRVDYMVAVTNNLLERTNILVDFWESGYKDTFTNATAISCTDNTRCLAFNQLINVVDVLRVTKLGKPAGLESSTAINAEGLEAFRSENSLVLLRAAIEEVEHVYFNSTINFSVLVNDIAGNTEVSDSVNTSFRETYTAVDAIDTSLYNAVLNKDPNVALLYNSLSNLIKYLSVDAASILSVTILPTDNDGD